MKQGTRTTEFWVSIAPVFASLVETLKGDTENSTNLIICGTVLGAFYIASRTAVKMRVEK